MTLNGAATRVTIYIGEDDQWHHHPVYTEIVHRAHRADSPEPPSSAASKGSASPPTSTPPASCP